jgi:hypothetical protein
MPTTFRKPPLRCWVDGQQLGRVISARVARSLDQEFATGEAILAWPPPNWLQQFQWVVLSMGGTPATAYDRLAGYVLGFTYELWPTAVTLHLGDPLSLCARFSPSALIDLTGMDDAQIVRAVLNEVGFPPALIGTIAGTGKIISETTLTWPLEESAMDLIKELDGMSEGFRTFAGLDGVIHRQWFDTLPSSSSAFDLTESVDILSGSVEYQLVEPKNQVTVIGADIVEAVATGPFVSAFRTTPAAPVNYPLVQYQDADAAHINATDIASWLLGQLNRNIVRTSLSTFRDDRFGMGSTVWVDSDHVVMSGFHWLQGVTSEMTEQGAFTQQLELISELSRDTNALTPGTVDPTGVGMPEIVAVPPTVTTVPSGISPGPTAGMTIAAIDQEKVVIGGVETTIYSLTAIDASTPLDAPITAWAWTAAGPGVSIASGSEQTFSTSFTNLTGASITLTVTDANAATGTITRSLDGGAGIPIKKRKLYAATSTDWAVFDGDTWRTDTPGGTMAAVAHGPAAAAGPDVLRTTDDLATPALHTSPFGANNTTATWMEEDNSPGFVAAAADDGRIALSEDGGATWTLRAGVGSSVRRVIRSRFSPDQVWAITAAGVYQSTDAGATFNLLRAGDFVDLLLSHSRNVVLTAAGGMERAESPGDPFVFPGSPTIVSMAPGIRSDVFFAFASDGTTYVSDDGAFTMTARASVPAGAPQIRGADADGDLVDLIYVATDANLYKSIDALRSSAGYLTLREGPHTLILHGKFAEPHAGGDVTWLLAAGGTGGGLFRLKDDGSYVTDYVAARIAGAMGQAADLFSDGHVSSTQYSHSGDFGVTWADTVDDYTPGPLESGTSGIAAGAVGVAYALVFQSVAFPNPRHLLVKKTTDGGASWSTITDITMLPLFSGSAGYVNHGQEIFGNAAAAWFGLDQETAGAGSTKTTLLHRVLADGSGGHDFALNGPSTTAQFNDSFTGCAPNHDDTDSAVAVAFDGGVYKLYHLVGTAQTEITPPGSTLRCADIWGSAMVAGLADNTIVKSTDGGASWATVYTASDNILGGIRFSQTDPNRIIAASGYSGKFWLTKDGGSSWTEGTISPWDSGSNNVSSFLVF